MGLTIAVFVGVACFVLLGAMLLSGERGKVETRLEELALESGKTVSGKPWSDLAGSTIPQVAQPLVPKDEKKRIRLRDRLIQAGLYKQSAMPLFVFIRLVLITIPVVAGVLLTGTGMISMQSALAWGLLAGLAGTLAPSMWLDKQKRDRQLNIRRSLPDALDVIVVCLDAGLSLPAGLQRVAMELGDAYPMLAAELKIVEREVQMGMSTGEALKNFGNRFDLSEIKSLASVILQAERYGASIAKALRVHADTLRIKRQQRAEELARAASTKMLFPTIIFIFPTLFVVCLGPAMIQIYQVLGE